MKGLLNKEMIFLLYFSPLFFIKMLNYTSESITLQVMGAVCLFFALFSMIKDGIIRLPYQLFLLLFSFLLVITTGKQAVLFSVIAILMSKEIRLERKVLKVLFALGLVAFAFLVWLSRATGGEGMRFNGEEWVEMTKRSNIIFVSYSALLSIYLVLHKTKLTFKKLALMAVISYFVYLFVGSRTGGACIVVLMIALVMLDKTKIYRFPLVRRLCICTPIICLCFSLATTLLYGKDGISTTLDYLLQGRVEQQANYMQTYGVSLFGQHIAQNSDWRNDFHNLDCAYMAMLIREGLIFTVLWLYATCSTIKYMYERKRFVEVAILIMVSVYGISETFLINCFLNPSLLLYGEWMKYRFSNKLVIA